MGVVRRKNEWEGVHSEFEETFLLSCLVYACTFDGFAISIVVWCEAQLQIIMGDSEKLWKIKTFIS